MQIVAADIGGTHARFALAELSPGERPRLGEMRQYRTRECAGLGEAWAKFERDSGGALPRAAAIAVAAPIEGEVLTFMNSAWRIERHAIAGDLGLDRLTLLNDFGAVAHAVSVAAPGELEPIAGPGALPPDGIASVIGPGTGLGVAILDRRHGRVAVIETEAAHIGFCPLDPEEEELADALTARYGRASVERVVSGPGLIDIYRFLGGGDWDPNQAGTLWEAAIDGADPIAGKALVDPGPLLRRGGGRHRARPWRDGRRHHRRPRQPDRPSAAHPGLRGALHRQGPLPGADAAHAGAAAHPC